MSHSQLSYTMARKNRFSHLQMSREQDMNLEDSYLKKKSGSVGPTRKNRELGKVGPDILNGEDEVAFVKENTRAWVQRTFYDNSKMGPGKEINYEKWKALDLLNKVEIIKRGKEKNIKWISKSGFRRDKHHDST